MRFGTAFLDELRDAIPLSTVVGQHVIWDKRKTSLSRRDFWACCPFHGEKSPSFHVDDRRGAYHCFGCGAHGDVFRFLVEGHGRTFPEAVEEVAHLAGRPLPEETPQARAAAQKRLSLIEISDAAMKWFGSQLRTSRETLAYAVEHRGISRDEIEEFKIGYAPEGNALLSAGIAPAADMVEAGLIGNVDGRNYDWFRGRLMFPILDAKGHALGFSGRSLDGDDPKYLNTPATALFDKGALLYNGAAARKASYDGAQFVAVEGNIDAIATSRVKYAAAAPMGTALTAAQAGLIAKSHEAPVFCFDGDAAGHKAQSRAIDVLLPMLSGSFTAKFATLPDGTDPDTSVKRDPDGFRRSIDGAMGFADALWRRETAGTALGVPEQRAKLEARLREALRKIEDQDTRRAYGENFADRLKQFGERPKVYRSNSYSQHSTAPSALRLANGFHRGAGLNIKEAILISAIAAAPLRAADLGEELTAARLSPEATRIVAKIVVAMMDAPTDAIAEILNATGLTGVVEDAMEKVRAAGIIMQLGQESATAIEVLDAVRH